MEFVFNLDAALMLLFLCALAGLAGFLAGLLGIGGGLVLVPGLYFVFTHFGYTSDTVMHVAVGTSLSTIIGTSMSSAMAHYRRGSVDVSLVKLIGIGMIAGGCIGTFTASQVTGFWLQVFFASVLVILAMLMRLDPEKFRFRDHMPAFPYPSMIGSVIGTIATLMGIGGAALNVPFMTLHNVPIHKAVGTSSALGVILAIPGAIGFFLIGLDDVAKLPPFTFGYINLLALAIIIPVTISVAPFGVAAAHNLSVKKLRRVFSIFMIFIALRMIYEVYRSSGHG